MASYGGGEPARRTPVADTAAVLRAAKAKCYDSRTVSALASIWDSVGVVIATRLAEGKGTKIPHLGTFTLAHDKSFQFSLAPEFQRAARCRTVKTTFTPGKVPTSNVNAFAVGQLCGQEKSVIMDGVSAIVVTMQDLCLSGQALRVQLGPAGSVDTVTKRGSSAPPAVTFTFQANKAKKGGKSLSHTLKQLQAANRLMRKPRAAAAAPPPVPTSAAAAVAKLRQRPGASDPRRKAGRPSGSGSGSGSGRGRQATPPPPVPSGRPAGRRGERQRRDHGDAPAKPYTPRRDRKVAAAGMPGMEMNMPPRPRSSRSRQGQGRPGGAGAGAGAGAGVGAATPPPPVPRLRGGGKGKATRKAATPQEYSPDWKDPKFPPTSSSLCYNWAGWSDGPAWKRLKWQRAAEFLGTTPKLFHGGIAVNDIQQGMLGDCYFLCSLSVLAENPHRVERLFKDEDGLPPYSMSWIQNGKPITITVDDYFPVNPDTGDAAFSRAVGPELWVLVAEKAWAKAHGSYQAIDAGNAAEVLSAMTGAPETIYKVKGKPNKEQAKAWEAILEADQKNWLIAGSVPEQPGDLEKEVGLIEAHAYAILRAAELSSGDRLVQLRNPWGKTEWLGDWSDDSPLWTSDLKRQLGWTDEDDGTFWMAYEDFCMYFDEVCTVRVNDDYVFLSVELPELSHASFTGVEVEVTQPVKGVFELHQPSKRSFIKQGDAFEFGGLTFTLLDVGCKPPRVVAEADALKTNSVFVDVELDPGTYVVIIRGAMPSRGKRQCYLTWYGSDDVDLGLVPSKGLQSLLASAWAAIAWEKGTPLDFGGIGGLSGMRQAFECGMALVYRNSSDSVTLNERLEVTMHNARMIAPRAAGYASTLSFTLRPGEEKKVVVVVDKPGDNWSASYSRNLTIQ